jgi:hypothetical protein
LIHHSSDEGQHWASVNVPDRGAEIREVANCATHFAAGARRKDVSNSGASYTGPSVFFSADGGDTWLPSSLTNHDVGALACRGDETFVSVEDPHLEEVAIGKQPSSEQIDNVDLIHSFDHGRTWSIPSVTDNVSSIVADDQHLDLLLRPIESAVDRYCYYQKSWICEPVRLRQFVAVTSLARSREAVYVGTNAASVLFSFNRGKTWAEFKLPVSRPRDAKKQEDYKVYQVTGIAVVPGGVVVATLGKGIFVCSSHGDKRYMAGSHEWVDVRSLASDSKYIFAASSAGVLRISTESVSGVFQNTR